VPALGLYTSLGFVPEKRLHRFYLNGKDAFRLVLPLCGAEDAAGAAAVTSVPSDKQRLAPALLQLPPPPHGTSDDDDEDDEEDEGVSAASAVRTGSKLVSSSLSRADDEEDYAENTAKLVRLRRRVAALRACRMVTVWPAEDDEDRVSGR
jgi:peptide alpha-N-acetyltransferase